MLRARLDLHAGPVQLAGDLGLAASTIGAVLRRWQLPHLRDLDRLSGELLRSRATDERYEHDRPGDLLHVDVKKLGRIPDGGGWRLLGVNALDHFHDDRNGVGFDFIHVAVDDHSRVAYAEIHPDERAQTCAAFLHRAATWFRQQHGVTVRRVLTDNALVYRRSQDWAMDLQRPAGQGLLHQAPLPVDQRQGRAVQPTLLTDWAYARPWTSTAERNAAFDPFLDRYNTRRGHTAAGGRPPISRLAA